MSQGNTRKAVADSLMEYLRLSDAQATILLDETTTPPTLRVYVFDTNLLASRKWPKKLEWQGYGVEIIPSEPFRPLAGREVVRTRDQERAVWDYLEREVTREDRAGRHTQLLCHVTKDFFDRFSAEEIPGVLAMWRLAERIRQSRSRPVVVTGDGIKWLHECPELAGDFGTF